MNQVVDFPLVSSYRVAAPRKRVSLLAQIPFLKAQIFFLAKTYDINPEYALEYLGHVSEISHKIPDTVRVEWCVFPKEKKAFQRTPSTSDQYTQRYNSVVVSADLLRQEVSTKVSIWGQLIGMEVKTKAGLSTLLDLQIGDMYIVPIQHGASYAGLNPIEARARFAPHEYGLTLFQCTTVALYGLKGLRHHAWGNMRHFSLIAGGDRLMTTNEAARSTDPQYEEKPCVYMWNDKLHISGWSTTHQNTNAGVATFFLPSLRS